MADTVPDQVAEMTAMAEASGHKNPLRHVYASPPPGASWDAAQWDAYWTLYESAMDLEGCAFSEAIHDKPGDHDRPSHRHRVYLALTERGTLVRIGHDYARQEAVSRIMEHDTGAAFVRGAHNIRAATMARSLGRDDVAVAMQAAGLLDGARARADLKPGDRAQQERTHVSKAGVAAMAAQAWAASDGGAAFVAALSEHGLRLAQGDKRGVPVVLDSTGNVHALSRLLSMNAKTSGTVAPKAADIQARLAGTALPSLDVARQQALPQPTQPQAPAAPPTMDAPPSDAPTMDAGGTAPGAASEPVHPMHSGAGGGQVSPGAGGGAASHEAPGSGALEDAGDGPGEPPGPNASPDERARYLARLAAYEERKAAAWARFIAGLQAAKRPTPPTSSGGMGHAGHTEIHGGYRGHAATQAAFAWIHAVREGSSTEAEASPESSSRFGTASRDGHAGSRAMGEVGPHDTRYPRQNGRGPDVAARPDRAASIGIPQPDNGNPGSPNGRAGEPAAAGAAHGPDGTAARKAFERHAATRRLERGLAAQPAAMAALRQASLELTPSWRAARETAQRIQTDHDRIARVLATHPHPDPADRDPKARAAAYTGQISQGIRDRREAVEAAQAQAATAVTGRSRLTRGLAAVGVITHEQREAVRLAQRATALADEAGRAVSRDDWKHAQATGEAHAYAAQRTTRLWEARPDVAKAIDDARLNAVVAKAVEAGDPAIQKAVDPGSPDAARNIIRQREAEEARRIAERERIADLARGLHGQGTPRPPGPGRM